MNDRYLFKAKDVDTNEWHIGFLVGFNFDYGWCFIKTPTNEEICYANTICQCTGRKDEWEHDIFEFDDDRYEIAYCEDSLTWDAASVFSSESISLGEFRQDEYIRIGNAIDNPELLEVE